MVKDLERVGIHAMAIHGNKSQGARQRALEQFKNGSLTLLIATDLAARGIDIDALQWVFNMDLPDVPETYVHRIGRTGRAGASGSAIAFCEPEELDQLRDIEILIKRHIPVVENHPWALPTPPATIFKTIGQGRGKQNIRLAQPVPQDPEAEAKRKAQIERDEKRRKDQARRDSRPAKKQTLSRGKQLAAKEQTKRPRKKL